MHNVWKLKTERKENGYVEDAGGNIVIEVLEQLSIVVFVIVAVIVVAAVVVAVGMCGCSCVVGCNKFFQDIFFLFRGSLHSVF